MPHLVATSIYLSQIYSYYIRGDRSPLKPRRLNLQYVDHVNINPLTAGAAYIWVFIFHQHILYILKIKCDINQQYLETVDVHFVKSELFSLT